MIGMTQEELMYTVIWFIGFALVVGSFGFLLNKPRQNRRPRISVEAE